MKAQTFSAAKTRMSSSEIPFTCIKYPDALKPYTSIILRKATMRFRSVHKSRVRYSLLEHTFCRRGIMMRDGSRRRLTLSISCAVLRIHTWGHFEKCSGIARRKTVDRRN